MLIEKTAWMLVFVIKNVSGDVVTGIQHSGVDGRDEEIEFSLHMPYTSEYVDFSGTIDDMPEMVQFINTKFTKSKTHWEVVTKDIILDVGIEL